MKLVSVTMIFAAALLASGPDSRLVDAEKKMDRTAVRGLLQQKVDVNAPAVDGSTALHWAANGDDLETAELLVRAGANAKAANRYGVTPLSLAAVNGNAAMIELLLKAGADPNTMLPEGETVLMTAARSGNVNAVKALLTHGANVNAKESGRGQTALMWAAAEGNTSTVEMLVEFGADIHTVSTGGFTPLLFAVREGKPGVVRSLLKAGASVNETLQRPQRQGLRGDGYAAGAAAGESALNLAVANAHYELAAMLLDAGADPNLAGQGWTPLHTITWIRRPGYASNDPAPAGSGSMSSIEIVRRLVAHKANVNAKMTARKNVGLSSLNSVGATPFLLAARTGDAELMRLLVELGADPKLGNADDTTPLMVAAGVGTRSPGEDAGTEPEALEAVKVALELGNDVNAIDKRGDTAVHGAAYKHLPLVAQFLIDHGARVDVWNQKDKSGWTPLRIADGVHRGMNLRSSPETAVVLRKAMGAAGVSTIVEPEINISGATR